MTRPTCHSQPPPSSTLHPHPPINNLEKVVEVACSNHLLVLELYARLGLTPPVTGTPTWSKAFLYTCRYCAENDHWTKDCPNPHRFDICYASRSEIQKALDNKLKVESPALLDSPKDEDNVIPIQAAPAPPEPETPPTLSTPSSEENPLCTSNPLGAAPPETPASGRRLPKGGAIVRATSPCLPLSPDLTPAFQPSVWWNVLTSHQIHEYTGTP